MSIQTNIFILQSNNTFHFLSVDAVENLFPRLLIKYVFLFIKFTGQRLSTIIYIMLSEFQSDVSFPT